MADLATLIAAFHLANEQAKQAEEAKKALTPQKEGKTPWNQ